MPIDTSKQTIQEVASQMRSKDEKAVETTQLVVFELDKEEYSSNISDLREIIKMRDVVPIPGAPAYIAGIINVRGQIVVVVDLEKRFLLRREEETQSRHIIIVEVEDNVFGVIVDEVTGVIRVPVDSVKPTPTMVTSKISVDYLNGVVVLQEAEQEQARLILLLDIKKMLSEKELLQFGKDVQATAKEDDSSQKASAASGTKAPVDNDIQGTAKESGAPVANPVVSVPPVADKTGSVPAVDEDKEDKKEVSL